MWGSRRRLFKDPAYHRLRRYFPLALVCLRFQTWRQVIPVPTLGSMYVLYLHKVLLVALLDVVMRSLSSLGYIFLLLFLSW